MRNLLFFLGGGALMYLYLNSDKKKLSAGIEKIEEAGKDLAENLDEAVANIKPNIKSSGEREFVVDNTGSSDLIPTYNINNLYAGRNGVRNSISALYKRYNTSREATISPSRVRVVSV